MANIFETARAEHQYYKFVKGVESLAGLVDTLSGPGLFTIFVPSDAAFDRLSSDQQATLFADPEKLARVLKYHIVPGYYTADDLLDRLFLKTLEGPRLRVWSDISMVPCRQRDHAHHRQSACPSIHAALTTCSRLLVPGYSHIYPGRENTWNEWVTRIGTDIGNGGG